MKRRAKSFFLGAATLFSAAAGWAAGGEIRISRTGPDGDKAFMAAYSELAYNSRRNEYLAVWATNDDGGPSTPGGREIYCQRIDGATKVFIGGRIRVSDAGPDGDSRFGATMPAVAYNSRDDEYLIVWRGEDDVNGLINDELEIFGQRLSGEGVEVGPNDFRISSVGPDRSTYYETYNPRIAYNSRDNDYLVVWHGKNDSPGMAYGEQEVFGQRISSSGAEVGEDDFRISDMGPDGVTGTVGIGAQLAYNSRDNEYLVVWLGRDSDVDLGTAWIESEVYGQRLSADGRELGVNDFRISRMGPDGDFNYGVYSPWPTYNPKANEYLVLWASEAAVQAELGEEEVEIFGQRLSASGIEIGADDFRISDMGPEGDTRFGLAEFNGLSAVYNPAADEYLAVWSGQDDTGSLVWGESEIFGQRLSPSGQEIGDNDFRITHMGPDGDPNFDAVGGKVAYNSASNEYFIVWNADDAAPMADGESEVFGQRLAAPEVAGLPPQNPAPEENGKCHPNIFRRHRGGHPDFRFSGLPPHARIVLCSFSGRRVAELASDAQGEIRWDGREVDGREAASGVYFARVEGARGRKPLKLVIQR